MARHLVSCHGAAICEQNPTSNSVSWEAKFNPNDFFSICRVRDWGIFFLFKVPVNEFDAATARFYIQSVGTVEKAEHFQFQLTLLGGESEDMSLTGNVEHISVPADKMECYMTCSYDQSNFGSQAMMNHKFRITIHKKFNKSGSALNSIRLN